MDDRPEANADHDVPSEIMEEHSSLRDLLTRIDQASSLDSLRKDIQQLEALLRTHFTAEETQLFPKLLKEAPYQDAIVTSFVEEHANLIRHIVSVRDAAARTQTLADVVSDSAGLIAELRNHEERETEVIMDTFFRDTGVGG